MQSGSIAESFEALAQLQQEGWIKHLGVSTVSAEQVAEAQSIAPIVCVQNFFNIAHRDDDQLIASLAQQNIAYVPYFPLGGFTPLQSSELDAVARRLDSKPMAVALAWLFQWHVRGATGWAFFVFGVLFAATYNLFACDWIAEKVV